MARRRHFLVGVTTASTIAIAGCSETDLEDLEGVGGNTSNESADDGAEETQESNNEESEEDEDADKQTGPEAALEQYRTGLLNGDVAAVNEVLYTDGERGELDDSYETPDIETIEYEISEVSSTEYESQTGNDFAEERIELTETGGDDFAIVRWDEELIREYGEERSYEQYFLLHQINQEWLIVKNIGTAPTESEGEETEEGPQEPLVVGVNVQTSPQVRVSPQIRNPTDERVERKIWVRVAGKGGGILATRSKIVTLNPTSDGAPATIPFFFDDVAWSGTNVDTENTEAVLTATDAGSPF